VCIKTGHSPMLSPPHLAGCAPDCRTCLRLACSHTFGVPRVGSLRTNSCSSTLRPRRTIPRTIPVNSP
jgi:hypothetical protein